MRSVSACASRTESALLARSACSPCAQLRMRSVSACATMIESALLSSSACRPCAQLRMRSVSACAAFTAAPLASRSACNPCAQLRMRSVSACAALTAAPLASRSACNPCAQLRMRSVSACAAFTAAPLASRSACNPCAQLRMRSVSACAAFTAAPLASRSVCNPCAQLRMRSVSSIASRKLVRVWRSSSSVAAPQRPSWSASPCNCPRRSPTVSSSLRLRCRRPARSAMTASPPPSACASTASSPAVSGGAAALSQRSASGATNAGRGSRSALWCRSAGCRKRATCANVCGSSRRGRPSVWAMPARTTAGSASSCWYSTRMRGIPALASSASSRWRVHSNPASAGDSPSRACSEAATSAGSRPTSSARGSIPACSSSGCHSGSRRHRRGSLTAHIGEPAKSRWMMAASAACASAAACERNQSPGMGRGSSQAMPSAPSRVSCTSTTSACSQKPAGLSGRAGIRRSPSSTPHRLSTPETAEVPLRCIPSTSTASGRWAAVTGDAGPARDVPKTGCQRGGGSGLTGCEGSIGAPCGGPIGRSSNSKRWLSERVRLSTSTSDSTM